MCYYKRENYIFLLIFMFQRLYTKRLFQNTPFYNRDTYENVLEDPNSNVGKKVNMFIQLCVFIAVGAIILETVGEY